MTVNNYFSKLFKIALIIVFLFVFISPFSQAKAETTSAAICETSVLKIDFAELGCSKKSLNECKSPDCKVITVTLKGGRKASFCGIATDEYNCYQQTTANCTETRWCVKKTRTVTIQAPASTASSTPVTPVTPAPTATSSTSTVPSAGQPGNSVTSSGQTGTSSTSDGQTGNSLSSAEQKTKSQAAVSSVSLDNPLNDIKTPQALIGRLINAVMGIIGSITLVMFIYGGFTWMTSAGSPEKVKKGRDILVWAVIGLVIVFSAYALVSLIINSVQ